jgi:hypothetical protein
MDEDTHRSAVHFHLFRKYFISVMTFSGVPEKYVDFFAGHLDELDRAYQRQTKENLLEIYLRGEPYLRVYDEGAEEVAQTKNEIRDVRDQLRDTQIERLTDRARLDDMKRESAEAMRKMQEEMAELRSLLPVSEAVTKRVKLIDK